MSSVDMSVTSELRCPLDTCRLRRDRRKGGGLEDGRRDSVGERECIEKSTEDDVSVRLGGTMGPDRRRSGSRATRGDDDLEGDGTLGDDSFLTERALKISMLDSGNVRAVSI